MFKTKKGITLIALIITIIVLLILAGVTINMVLGENGLFNKAKTSVGKYENAQEKENITLTEYETEIDNARETVTISKQEYDMLKNGNNYSTDEKIVGTWFGKPLYATSRYISLDVSYINDTRNKFSPTVDMANKTMRKVDGVVEFSTADGLATTRTTFPGSDVSPVLPVNGTSVYNWQSALLFQYNGTELLYNFIRASDRPNIKASVTFYYTKNTD